MNGNAARFVRFGAGLLGLVVLGWVLTGQAAKPAAHGFPTDWTHQHVIYSQPATAERARLIERDPRYAQQWYRGNVARVLPVDAAAQAVIEFGRVHSVAKSKIHKDWSENMGTGATVGAGNFAAKWAFSSTTANCSSAANPDFVAFSTGLQSSSTVASIVAFDNLYSGCTGTVPTTYWAYNTTASAPGTIMTSPVISLDGTQIAFAQTDGLNHGTVVLLKWKANDGTLAAPSTPNVGNPASYAACAVLPCLTSFDLRTSAGVGPQTDDTTSSVYYDYTGDVAWVGDSLGRLHKFHPFFNGTPAEVSAPWPVHVNTTTFLSSPVYDHISGNVFVGDASGFLESVNATTGAVVVSAQLDFGTGILSGPVIDIGNEFVYAFASSDNGSGCGGGPCAAVYQLPATFGALATGTKVTVGASGVTPKPMYFGTFDSAYLSSAAVGSLYVCGNTGAAPSLYRIPISGTTLPAAGTAVAAVGTAAGACSPVTNIPNPSRTVGSTEYAYFSVQGTGRPPGCGGAGCLISYATAPWKPNTTYLVGQEIVTSGGRVETATTSTGTSGSGVPAWPTTAGTPTLSDGTVNWVDQGIPTAGGWGNWVANHAYTAPTRILDPAGYVEVVTGSGTSDPATQPSWPTVAGTSTSDGSVTWVNAGLVPINALQTAGGTSGIINDNTVGSGVLTGASQVYFSILGSQSCPTSGGTGGCAIQTSQ